MADRPSMLVYVGRRAIRVLGGPYRSLIIYQVQYVPMVTLEGSGPGGHSAKLEQGARKTQKCVYMY